MNRFCSRLNLHHVQQYFKGNLLSFSHKIIEMSNFNETQCERRWTEILCGARIGSGSLSEFSLPMSRNSLCIVIIAAVVIVATSVLSVDNIAPYLQWLMVIVWTGVVVVAIGTQVDRRRDGQAVHKHESNANEEQLALERAEYEGFAASHHNPYREQSLETLLAAEGFAVWPLEPERPLFAAGFRIGVTVSQCETLCAEKARLTNIIRRYAEENRLVYRLMGPMPTNGKGLGIYCGFSSLDGVDHEKK